MIIKRAHVITPQIIRRNKSRNFVTAINSREKKKNSPLRLLFSCVVFSRERKSRGRIPQRKNKEGEREREKKNPGREYAKPFLQTRARVCTYSPHSSIQTLESTPSVNPALFGGGGQGSTLLVPRPRAGNVFHGSKMNWLLRGDEAFLCIVIERERELLIKFRASASWNLIYRSTS